MQEGDYTFTTNVRDGKTPEYEVDYATYRLEDFSSWLKNVVNSDHWTDLIDCFNDRYGCEGISFVEANFPTTITVRGAVYMGY